MGGIPGTCPNLSSKTRGGHYLTKTKEAFDSTCKGRHPQQIYIHRAPARERPWNRLAQRNPSTKLLCARRKQNSSLKHPNLWPQQILAAKQWLRASPNHGSATWSVPPAPPPPHPHPRPHPFPHRPPAHHHPSPSPSTTPTPNPTPNPRPRPTPAPHPPEATARSLSCPVSIYPGTRSRSCEYPRPESLQKPSPCTRISTCAALGSNALALGSGALHACPHSSS